jgi:hypothetical protein
MVQNNMAFARHGYARDDHDFDFFRFGGVILLFGGQRADGDSRMDFLTNGQKGT